jgi:hypothetical protein
VLQTLKKIWASSIKDDKVLLIYYRIKARVIYTKRSKFVKNEHVRYTLEYFPVDNARYLLENIPVYTAHVHFLRILTCFV